MDRMSLTAAPTTALLAKAAWGARMIRWRENLASQLESISRNADGPRSMPHLDLLRPEHAQALCTALWLAYTAPSLATGSTWYRCPSWLRLLNMNSWPPQ